MFKVNDKNTRMTPLSRSGVFFNFESNFTPFSGVSIVAFEQVKVSSVYIAFKLWL